MDAISLYSTPTCVKKMIRMMRTWQQASVSTLQAADSINQAVPLLTTRRQPRAIARNKVSNTNTKVALLQKEAIINLIRQPKVVSKGLIVVIQGHSG